MKIKLTEQEHALILAGGFLSADLLAPFQKAEELGGRFRRFMVTLDAEQAYEVREALIDRLLHVGFDKDYEPTPDGRMLEDLIDKFSAREKV